jgi:hypothetical protein
MVKSRPCYARPNLEMSGFTRIYYSMVFNSLDATVEANRRTFCVGNSIKVEGLTSFSIYKEKV